MKFKKDEVVKKVGSKIREIRMSKGLSIEKAALDAEMEYTQLSRIELGKINTSIYQVYKISNSLSITIPELFKDLHQNI
jgi:transcriptional regulator with XRE-family HTH domain